MTRDDAAQLSITLDRELCYRALQTRDARFDGRFYTAVTTTGIYCRPICPARTPKLDHCIFLPSAAAAHALGFRSCLRCRPEIAPGLAGFRGSANTVRRALSLIAEGGFDDDGVEAFAERLGVGSRHLRRLFDEHLGASPVVVAQTQRVLFAKRLLTETSLPMTEIALAAGFGSVRRFNDVFVRTYGRPPSQLRGRSESARELSVDVPGVRLKLPFRPPYDWPSMIGFFGPRALIGVEHVDDERYARTFCIGEARGTVQIEKLPDQHALQAVIHASDVRVLGTVVTRLRRMFDLDADAAAIDACLVRDPQLRKRVRARPGLRVPGAWDAFELAVRAVLGQQVSVTAATTFARRLVAVAGSRLSSSTSEASAMPNMLFPSAAQLSVADLSGIGLTSKRRETLHALAQAVTRDPTLLEASASLDETVTKLVLLPGIGPWTAQYIAMRALREPDAFPAADLGLLRAVAVNDQRPTPAQLLQQAEAWRPWRAYATLRLWTQ